MRRLPVRQVHLDFHTSEFMEKVGSQFDKKQFQEALKEGHVSSITIFGKCQHGRVCQASLLGQGDRSEGGKLCSSFRFWKIGCFSCRRLDKKGSCQVF